MAESIKFNLENGNYYGITNHIVLYTRVFPKVSVPSHNEINNSSNKNNKNEHSLRSDTKGYGGKTH
jgi:hypothetical protein